MQTVRDLFAYPGAHWLMVGATGSELLWFATWEPTERIDPSGSGRITRTRMFKADLATGRILAMYAPLDTAAAVSPAPLTVVRVIELESQEYSQFPARSSISSATSRPDSEGSVACFEPQLRREGKNALCERNLVKSFTP